MTTKHTAGIKFTVLLLAAVIVLTGCTATTRIQSNPSGAKVYLDDEQVGVTPYVMRDRKIVFTETNIRLEKEGYETFNTIIARDEEPHIGAIVAGCFFFLPLAWCLEYKPLHNYELTPLGSKPAVVKEEVVQPKTESPASNTVNTPPPAKKSKADRLREMKQLLDEKILTQEEYDKEKAKILNEPD